MIFISIYVIFRTRASKRERDEPSVNGRHVANVKSMANIIDIKGKKGHEIETCGVELFPIRKFHQQAYKATKRVIDKQYGAH